MRPKSEGLLWDIEDAAQYIVQLTRDRTIDDYVNDRTMRQAVERNFEIIGEAIHQLRDSDRRTARRIPRYRNLIELRNSVIHNFGEVDDYRLFDLARERVPELIEQIHEIQRTPDDYPEERRRRRRH